MLVSADGVLQARCYGHAINIKPSTTVSSLLPTHRPYSSRVEPRTPALAAGPPSRALRTSTPFTPSCSTAPLRAQRRAGRRRQAHLKAGLLNNGGRRWPLGDSAGLRASHVMRRRQRQRQGERQRQRLEKQNQARTRLVWRKADAHDGPHHLAVLDDLRAGRQAGRKRQAGEQTRRQAGGQTSRQAGGQGRRHAGSHRGRIGRQHTASSPWGVQTARGQRRQLPLAWSTLLFTTSTGMAKPTPALFPAQQCILPGARLSAWHAALQVAASQLAGMAPHPAGGPRAPSRLAKRTRT